MILVILDYGSGNLKSVYNSIWRAVKDNNLNHKIIVSNKVNDIKRGDYIILPGVGSYANCMTHLVDKPGLLEHLEDFVLYKKKPFLGICVGMQLMAEYGLENGKTNGLGWIKGIVKHLDWFGNCKKNKLKIPHMGWNNVKVNIKNKLFDKVNEEEQFYFVHSYFFETGNRNNILATSYYSFDFPSVISKENIIGVQFHPEKSGNSGQKVLTNWLTKY